ncbi:MAG: YCF48-related protein, partial [Nanoarchaeota archaeon]
DYSLLLNVLIYNYSFGSISWNKTNLTINFSLPQIDEVIFLQNNLVGLADNPWVGNSTLNSTAQIQIKNLSSTNKPRLKKAGARCDGTVFCNLSYDSNNGILTANISSFSNYTTDTIIPSVTSISPSNGSTYISNDSITISAIVTDFGSSLDSVLFSYNDADTGFAVGHSGLILRTTDGGSTWSSQTSGTVNNLYGVHFLNATLGSAVGESGTIVRTVDGGTTWTNQTSGTANQLNSILLLSADVGIAVGNSGTIIVTTNSGTTWSSQTSGTVQNLTDIEATGFSGLFTVGTNGTVLRTTNSGSTWTNMNFNATSKELRAVSFTDALTITAVGFDGDVIRNRDAGDPAYWVNSTELTSADFFGMQFIDNSTGTIVDSGGGIYRTTDGGTSWTQQQSGVSTSIRAVSFTSSEVGTAVGNSGTILHTTDGGTTWTNQTSGVLNNLYGVIFPEVSRHIIVGNSGRISNSINRIKWDADSSGVTENLRAISLVNEKFAVAVGQSGTIVRTTNGGETWNSQSSGTTKSLRGVSFINTNVGTAVGESGTIIRTINGFAWSNQTSGTPTDLEEVYFMNTTYGFAVGAQGTIIHTDDGTTWSNQTSGVVQDLTSLSFVNANTGTVVGKNGIILRTTNGGAVWNDQSGITAEDLYGVSFINSNVGTAVGTNGVVIHTTNGGTTWATQTSGTGVRLENVVHSTANVIMAAGHNGAIIYTTNAGEWWRNITSDVSDNFTAIAFSGAEPNLVASQSGNTWSKSLDLHTLSDGVREIRVYANDSYNNLNYSENVYIVINNVPAAVVQAGGSNAAPGATVTTPSVDTSTVTSTVSETGTTDASSTASVSEVAAALEDGTLKVIVGEPVSVDEGAAAAKTGGGSLGGTETRKVTIINQLEKTVIISGILREAETVLANEEAVKKKITEMLQAEGKLSEEAVEKELSSVKLLEKTKVYYAEQRKKSSLFSSLAGAAGILPLTKDHIQGDLLKDRLLNQDEFYKLKVNPGESITKEAKIRRGLTADKNKRVELVFYSNGDSLLVKDLGGVEELTNGAALDFDPIDKKLDVYFLLLPETQGGNKKFTVELEINSLDSASGVSLPFKASLPLLFLKKSLNVFSEIYGPYSVDLDKGALLAAQYDASQLKGRYEAKARIYLGGTSLIVENYFTLAIT